MEAGVIQVSVAMAPVAVRIETAACLLGMSRDSFERYVQPEVRCIRRKSLKLYPVSELHRWAEENAEMLLDGRSAGA